MKTTILRWLPAIALVFTMQSCEEPGNAPLSDCVAASIEYRNAIEGVFYQQNNYSNEDLGIYNNMPRSITVPSGSMVKINPAWNFEKYAGGFVEIDRILVETTIGGVTRTCKMIYDPQSSPVDLVIPAYANTTINVKFILKTGEEQVVGPFNVTVQDDSKLLNFLSAGSFASSGSLLTTNVASEQEGSFYLWSPYFMIVNSAFLTHKAPLGGSFNKSDNDKTSTALGLLALTKTGLPANQIKVVASDRIEALNLYPELVQAYGCFLGSNYARFEAVNLNLDTTNLQASFENFMNSHTYSNLDTISLSNPLSELVVSKAQPAFKFVTSGGKKGYAVVSFSQGPGSSLFFSMQR